MTVFTTFKDAAAAARKTAMDRQQTVYVFRVQDDKWDISIEPREMRESSNTQQDPDRPSIAPPTTGPVVEQWEAAPF